jgi:hypothetical protein
MVLKLFYEPKLSWLLNQKIKSLIKGCDELINGNAEIKRARRRNSRP